MDLLKRIDWPAALILSVGAACLTAVWILGPAEYRDELASGVAAVWALSQAFARELLHRSAP